MHFFNAEKLHAKFVHVAPNAIIQLYNPCPLALNLLARIRRQGCGCGQSPLVFKGLHQNYRIPQGRVRLPSILRAAYENSQFFAS